MPNPPMTDDELREQLSALKPHTDNQIPLGSLLSVKELDAILSLIHQRETALLERVEEEVIGDNPDYGEKQPVYMQKIEAQVTKVKNAQRRRLATIKKDVGGTE